MVKKNTIYNRCSRDKCDGKSCKNVGTDEVWERERKNTIRKRRSREKWDGKNYVHKQEQMNGGNGKEKKIRHNRRSRDKQDGGNCEHIGTDELQELERKK